MELKEPGGRNQKNRSPVRRRSRQINLTLRLALGIKEGRFMSSVFSEEGASISASAVPQGRIIQKILSCTGSTTCMIVDLLKLKCVM